jgi:hypothetical protein
MSSNAIIFICHNNESIEKVIDKIEIDNVYFMIVGFNEIREKYTKHPKIIFARNFSNHIEKEKELLTLTAWYCISKNNLFRDKEYLCLLEYDVILEEFFIPSLNQLCQNNNVDVISFIYSDICLEWITKRHILEPFINLKKMNLPANEKYHWFPTTNQCIRRKIVDDFVDWYYPDCHILKTGDPNFFAHYHERLFSYYAKETGKRITCVPGLNHLFLASHKNFTENNTL